jgi:hypothetical protein
MLIKVNNCKLFSPWLGTCIGSRNYIYFFGFVASVVMGSLFILGVSGLVLFQWIYRIPTNKPILRLVSICVMIPWSLSITVFAGSLFLLHIILIYRGQTTTEFFRGVRGNRRYAFMDYLTSGLCRFVYQQGNPINSSETSLDQSRGQVNSFRDEVLDCMCPLRTLLYPMYGYRDENDQAMEDKFAKAVMAVIHHHLDTSN